ncbi:TonB-dependent receptor [Phenylobacterium zucineum HLK1]|uniref:TonB-dependent receptor n=1 Tax=Phenylobacterium zucineum (strain HLK1) TaxID=450851 RepID=B4RH07_PHEZH|nr:TonB-dependent receptor [Phenylobacterium zucineum]ACG78955.1 TonB-dependent receptor [Phenylobacterium zucineum HLK1]
MLKWRLFACASATSLALSAGAAMAQEIEEVIVTAQKREESLQEVPVAVTALSAEAMAKAGVTESRELMYITPGLVFTQGSFVSRPQVRGVGTRAVGPGDEATVPLYIDGVYQSSQHAGFFDFNNIQRVEVLRGPQGTLFGRNAVGGAINIVTYDPSPNPEMRLAASYGRFNERKGDIYLNGGLSENLAANIAIHANADDGYVKDLVSGDSVARTSSFGVRSKLLWRPIENTKVIVGAAYINSHDDTALKTHPIDGITAAKLVDPNVLIPTGYNSALSVDSYFGMHQTSAWANSVSTFSGFDLTFLGSWQKTELGSSGDSDGTVVDSSYSAFSVDDRSYTAELRASSNGEGPFQWIAGLFYFQGQARYGFGDTYFLVRGGPTAATQILQSDSDATSYAVFAEGSYDLTERLSLTAGLRYSTETRDFRQWNDRRVLAPGQTPPPPPPNGPPVSSEFDKLSPRLSVKYAFSDRVRGYFTYSQGFKSGLYNASAAALPLTPVKPEVLDSYEVGLKTEPARGVRLNAVAFYYDYKDLQVSARNVSGGLTLQNAATAEIYGSEVELAWAPRPNWSVNAAVAYNHARFKDFPGAQIFQLRPPTVVNGVTVTTPGYLQVLGDASGNHLPKAPDWTFNLSTLYTTPLWGGELALSGLLYWSDEYYSDNGNSYKEPSYENLNAQVAWTDPGERWRFTLWGENLTNTKRLRTNSLSGGGNIGILAPPRRYGVSIEYMFR